MKFKAMKRAIAALAATVMTVGLLAGCGGGGGSSSGGGASSDLNEDGTINYDEPVELSMYVISDRPAGQDVVDENLNKVLQEKMPNTTLKINWMGWAEYSNKYPLLFTSGEVFDLAYSATWVNFANLAQKGAFKKLDDLWPTYAPKNFAAASDTAKEQATVGDGYYCVPTQLATYTAYGPIYRTDLVEGTSFEGKTVEDWESLEEYMDAVKETHPEMECVDVYSTEPEIFFVYAQSKGLKYVDNGNRYMWFDPTEEKPTITTIWDWEGTKDYLEMAKRWNEKGFFSKAALSDTNTTKTQNGKCAMKLHNVDNYRTLSILQPDWNFKYTNFVADTSHLPFTQDCMVISNTSQHPERAMAFWEMVTTDQELYDALMYGVEGTTYQLNDEGQFEILDADLYSEGAMWAARTNELTRNQIGTPDDYDTMKEEWEGKIVAGQNSERFAGFVFDTSSIETQIASCSSAHQQYWWPLSLAYTDINTGLEEYKTQMEAAGVQAVIDAAQEQLDAYCEAHPVQ